MPDAIESLRYITKYRPHLLTIIKSLTYFIIEESKLIYCLVPFDEARLLRCNELIADIVIIQPFVNTTFH